MIHRMVEPPQNEITRRIVEAFKPQRVIVFGSRAHGTPRPESDLDLMVEMETTLSPADRVLAVFNLFGLRSWALDVVVFTPSEVVRQRAAPESLVNAIEKEGRVVYERP